MNYITTHQKPPLSFPSVSGAVCTFNSQFAGLPLKSHTVSLVAKQESGTPSPSNPLLISGWDAIRIGSISDNTNINYFKGVLNGTYGFIDLGDVSWSLLASGRHRTPNIPNMYSYSGSDTDFICSTYKSVILNDIADIDKSISLYTSGGSLYAQVNDSDLNGMSGADFKDAVSGVLIYKLATPTTPSFTSAEFKVLCEAFGVNGQYAEIQIGSTVYGGEYDAITGVLTATHQYFEFDGSADENWSIIGSGDERRFGYNTGVSMTDASTAITNYLSYLYGNRGSWGTFTIANNTYIICHDNQSNFSTVGDFTTYLSNNTLQLVGKLATPTTIQLPTANIETLLGENNVWADTGDTTLQYIKLG